MYIYGACLFYVGCSDSLGVLKYVVCLCSGCGVFCLYCDAWNCRC